MNTVKNLRFASTTACRTMEWHYLQLKYWLMEFGGDWILMCFASLFSMQFGKFQRTLKSFEISVNISSCWTRHMLCLYRGPFGTGCPFIHIAATINSVIMIMYLQYYNYNNYYYFIHQCIWFIKHVADFQWIKLALSWKWKKCVKCVACPTSLSVTNSISSKDILFWKFVELCEMCCHIACTI